MNIKLFDRYFEETEESFETRVNTWINKMDIEVVDVKFTSTTESVHCLSIFNFLPYN